MRCHCLLKTTALVALATVLACGSDGNLGRPCISPPSFDQGSYCNGDLVCNAQDICEEPHTEAFGQACDSDAECQIGLWCNYRLSPNTCDHTLGLGESCIDPESCSPGLACTPDPDCVVDVDAGPNAQPLSVCKTQTCQPTPDAGANGEAE